MAYTKTTWSSDTSITSSLLNHVETQYDEGITALNAHNHDNRYYTESESDSRFWHAGNDGSGSGCDADLLYHPLGNKHASDFSGASVPSGLIAMWYGTVQNIPTGWVLCDGQNGTPDLRDRFVYGLDSGSPTTGGSNSVTPTGSATIGSTTLTVEQLPAHTHSYTDQSNANNGNGTTYEGTSCKCRVVSDVSYTTNATGGGQGHTHPGTLTFNQQENRPQFFALYFIMKM